jgi:Peptidase C39 family
VQLIEGAREGLGAFHGNQGIAYLCGPAALKNILRVQKANPRQIKVAEDARSGPHGFSLEQLAALADKAKFKYKLIRREVGQPIPVPSIINWDVHHYAAITGMQGGKYQLQDPTFGSGGPLVTGKAIHAGGSGYFLVPASVIAANPKAGWSIVSAHSSEARTVYGMGSTISVRPGSVTHCDIGTSPQGGNQTNVASSSCGCSTSCPPQPQMAIASARIQEDY